MNNILEELHRLATKQMQSTELYDIYDNRVQTHREEFALCLTASQKQQLAQLLDYCESLQGIANIEIFKKGVACGYSLANELGAYQSDET